MSRYRRRSLGAKAMEGVSSSLSDVLAMLLQNRMLDTRATKAVGQQRLTSQLSDFQTKTDALSTPDNVDKFGPDIAHNQYQNLRRRLPRSLEAYVGAEPDFKGLERSPVERLAGLGKDIGSASKPEDAALNPAFIMRRSLESRVNPTPQASTLGMDASGNLNPAVKHLLPLQNPDGSTFVNPTVQALLDEAAGRKKDLTTAQEDATLGPVDSIGANGAKQTQYLTRGQRAGQTFQTERTAGQEAGRQGNITSATEQAKTDVETNPANVKKFASREAALAYSKQLATQRADQQMGAGSFKRTTQVVEGAPDESGNKTWQVIDTSPDQVGSSGVMAGGEKPTSQAERVASGYLRRGITEHNDAARLEPVLLKRGATANWIGMKAYQVSPSLVTDPVLRQYLGAQQRFINAALGRPESGGAITEDEYKKYAVNFYQPGDDEATLQTRQRGRREVVAGLATQAGPRLGGVTVTASEVAADAAERGVTLDEAMQEAASQGLLVIR